MEAIAPLLLAQAQAAEDLGRQLEVSVCVCVCMFMKRGERTEGVDELGGIERGRERERERARDSVRHEALSCSGKRETETERD